MKIVIEFMWRIVTVVVVLSFIGIHNLGSSNSWIWNYLIPLSGFYWAAIPAIDEISLHLKILRRRKQNETHRKDKQTNSTQRGDNE